MSNQTEPKELCACNNRECKGICRDNNRYRPTRKTEDHLCPALIPPKSRRNWTYEI